MNKTDRRKKISLNKKAFKLSQKGDWLRATLAYMDLWELDPEDDKNLILLSQSLVRIGAREKAIYVLEKALKVNGPRIEILMIMGNLAKEMKMHEIAEKIYVQFIKLFPDNAAGYLGYCNSLGGQDRFQESLDLLQQIIPQFPNDCELWNILASHLFKTGRISESVPFYEEALKLNQNYFAALNNLSLSYQYLGDIENSFKYTDLALKLQPGNPEITTGKAMRLLEMGELKEGWKCYESRLDPRRGDNINFTVALPLWKGEDLKDKTILLRSEQGIGDEVLFAHFYEPLFKMAKKVIIGCEIRLQSVFQRSFPNVDAYHHASGTTAGNFFRGYPELDEKINKGEEKVDFAITIGSVPQYLHNDVDNIPLHNEGLFKPDPKRVSYWKKKFDKLGAGKKIGISWKSGMTGNGRDLMYFTLDDISTALQVKETVFINLQYTDCSEEIKTAEEKYGIKIHSFDEIDLRNDLDDVFAYTKALDLVIGTTSSPTMFSISAGVPTWWLSKGPSWYFLGKKDHPPFFTKTRSFHSKHEEPWDNAVVDLVKKLKHFVETGDPIND